MITSLNTAITGLRDSQLLLSIVANNIANATTPGFKKSRVIFADLLLQTLQGATAPSGNQGGLNPKQIGLGALPGALAPVFVPGTLQVTGRPTDVAIQGNGFFVLTDGSDNLFYTRAGAFTFDADGNFVDTVTGYKVQKVNPLPANAESVFIDASGNVFAVVDGQQQQLGTIQVATFSNPEGLLMVGQNLYRESPNSGTANPGNPGTDGRGILVAGALEASNVDLAEEFTNLIVAQRSFQANARLITTSDQVLEELVNLKR